MKTKEKTKRKNKEYKKIKNTSIAVPYFIRTIEK